MADEQTKDAKVTKADAGAKSAPEPKAEKEADHPSPKQEAKPKAAEAKPKAEAAKEEKT